MCENRSGGGTAGDSDSALVAHAAVVDLESEQRLVVKQRMSKVLAAVRSDLPHNNACCVGGAYRGV